MKEAPHEKMRRDEVEYAEQRARAYAVCCSQRDLDDVDELRGAFWAGFKSACAYLRAPGIRRAEIVDEAPEVMHILSQDGQPYGSERRCCNHCGIMLWGASAPLHVDNWSDWQAHPDRCVLP